ncbi:MAG: VOC family protein [Candidatus Riflebacteria bacterium]|nr:VOC family protein [Candidatus Riflebacteria bacterium]
MEFKFNHNNINVFDLEKSVAFYKEALGLVELRRHSPADNSFTLVFLGDGNTQHRLELTWMRNRTEKYNLGDNEFHLALTVDDFKAANEKHRKMGCICYENPTMGIYFIEDPDGYWVEILPARRTSLPNP